VKSALRRLRNQASKPPVPLSTYGYRRGNIFDLGVGRASKETQLRAYGRSGTVFSIVSLLAEAAAGPTWRLYKSQPVDGRRRYATSDVGDDQRTEVISHAAIQLWNQPNDFHSAFEFREGSNQHMELTGETFWVLDLERTTFPTSMWYVRPDRMEPVPSPEDYLVGWIYNGPNGEQVPLALSEVIQEKRPDPLDPYRGFGPVGSVLPNIEQQRYATEYQRNLFINGADPGGLITVPNRLSQPEFDELVERWREGHQGIARAGAVGVLENGAVWSPAGQNNKDLEYGNLRLANRDELREAWRMHKSMLGTVEDVNRANAQTAEEVFVAWSTLPRLERRKDTLNCKLLPTFGQSGVGVEFDYDDPSPVNQEAANAELLVKAQAAQALVAAGYDQSDVLEVVGLPDMDVAEKPTQEPALPPGWVAVPPGGAGGAPSGDTAPAAPDAAPSGPVNGIADRYLAGRPKAVTAPAAWPGWEYDVTVAAIYTGQIATAVLGAVAVADLAEQWQATYPPPPVSGQPPQPQPPTPAEIAAAAAFAGSMGVQAAITAALTPVFASLWAEGWFLGQASADSVVTGNPPDWRDWTPGDADAARTGALRDLQGFIGDQYGKVAAIADTYASRLTGAMATAKKQYRLGKALKATLKGTLSDRQHAAVAAHTEMSRSQFGAAGLVFRKNHITSIDVVTAGDAKVCPACDALMAANPHPIPMNGLSDLLPVHPDDRCVALPASRGAGPQDMTGLLRRVLSDGYVPVEMGRR
jgi:HK97 family phage portal protein